MRFRIDLKLFLIILIFILTKQIQIYILMMGFAIIHELGHLFAGIFLKMKPEKLEFIPVGVSVSFKVSTDDINKKIGKTNILELKKIFVALAGPFINLLIILIVSKTIYPLDGGRIIKGIIEIIKGKKKAIYYTNKISIIMTILLTILSIIVLYYNFNLAIIFIMIYIWILVIKENKIAHHKQKIYQILEKNY